LIIRHRAELLDDLRITEVAGGGISRPAAGDGSDMSRLARQGFCAHDHRDRIEAFGRLISRHAIVGGDDRPRPNGCIFRKVLPV
jgi:hypothetical protein